MPLIVSPLHGVPLIKPGSDLISIIIQTIEKEKLSVHDGDIIAVTQKIVSKSEGRYINLNGINPSSKAKEISRRCGKDPRFVELVLKESKEVIRISENTLIVEHKMGFICANAGIDHSNVGNKLDQDDEWVLLLPENPELSAEKIKVGLSKYFNQGIGVIIIDSHGRPWRLGTVGVAIGISGVPALVDLRGKRDIFGYEMRITQVAAVDELAAAASLVMGQVDEKIPVVLISGFPYPLRKSSLQEVLRPKKSDLFR